MSIPSTVTSLRIVSGVPRGHCERLYAENTRLVGVALTRFPFLTGEDREEALGVGLLGLWQAARRYDPSRGFTFGTYAGDYIRGAVLHHLTRQRRQQRLACVSLETPIGSDGESDLADVIADDQAEKPGAALLDEAGFDGLLRGLPVKQQAVVRAMYQEERPLSSIAEEMGVSRQRCGQLHLSALSMLRKAQGRDQAVSPRG